MKDENQKNSLGWTKDIEEFGCGCIYGYNIR